MLKPKKSLIVAGFSLLALSTVTQAAPQFELPGAAQPLDAGVDLAVLAAPVSLQVLGELQPAPLPGASHLEATAGWSMTGFAGQGGAFSVPSEHQMQMSSLSSAQSAEGTVDMMSRPVKPAPEVFGVGVYQI